MSDSHFAMWQCDLHWVLSEKKTSQSPERGVYLAFFSLWRALETFTAQFGIGSLINSFGHWCANTCLRYSFDTEFEDGSYVSGGKFFKLAPYQPCALSSASILALALFAVEIVWRWYWQQISNMWGGLLSPFEASWKTSSTLARWFFFPTLALPLGLPSLRGCSWFGHVWTTLTSHVCADVLLALITNWTCPTPTYLYNEDLQAKAYMNHGMAPATFQDQTHYFTISLKPSGVQCDFHLVVQELAKGSGTSSNSLRRYALDTRPCRESRYDKMDLFWLVPRKVAGAAAWGEKVVGRFWGCLRSFWCCRIRLHGSLVDIGDSGEKPPDVFLGASRLPAACIALQCITMYNHVIFIHFGC